MAHVDPARWAAAAAGRLAGAELQAMEAHAAQCPSCAAQRARVEDAVAAFEHIRGAEPPALGWDHIGARIYWATSQARHNAARPRRRWPVLLPVAAVATAAAAWLLWLGPDPAGQGDTGPSTTAGAAQPDSRPPGSRLPASAPANALDAPPTGDLTGPARGEALRGVVTFLQGEVTAGDDALGFDDLVAEGARLSTAAGRVSVQFDAGGGFTLGERSSVTLARFDADRVILEVAGDIAVDVSPRRTQRSLAVVAGSRTVEVTGTVFRVLHRDGQLRVACSRGAVTIRDDGGEILPVGAGQVALYVGRELRRSSLELSEIAAMSRAVPRIPAWAEPETVLATSATLDIASSARGPVAVDGIPVGAGSFSLRVMPGRHHVETRGVAGSWLDVAAGSLVARRIEPAPGERVATDRPNRDDRGDRDVRIAQLRRALDRSPGVDRCMRPLRKQGIVEGSFVAIDIGILASGAVGHLNIVDSNLPGSSARCIRDVVDRVDFPAGPAATLRYRITP